MNLRKLAKSSAAALILLSVTACATDGKTRPDFCSAYPDKPPVSTRDGQDPKTDKEIVDLAIYWEVWCNAL